MSDITSNLIFKGYKVQQMKFRTMDNDPSIKNFKINPKIGFNFKKFDKGIDVVLSASIEKDEDHPIPFELNTSIIGRFVINNNDEISIDKLIPKGAEILFPYLRSTVSSIIMTANIPPYILPTINVAQIFTKENLKNIVRPHASTGQGTEITKVFL